MKAKKLGLVLSAFAVVMSPVVAAAASDTDNVTINASVGSTISMTTNGTVAISLTPTSGGVVSSQSDTVTINTNATTGYTLTLADADANTNLVSGGNNIPKHTGTFNGSSALGVNTWGYAIATGTSGAPTNDFDASYSAETNNGSSTSKWAGMPASGSPQNLRVTSSTATNEVTTVWYGVKVDTSKPNGTYSDTVTYTATTN